MIIFILRPQIIRTGNKKHLKQKIRKYLSKQKRIDKAIDVEKTTIH